MASPNEDRVKQHLHRGSTLQSQKQFLEAEAEYKAALELVPTNSIGRQKLLYLYLEMGREDKVLQELDRYTPQSEPHGFQEEFVLIDDQATSVKGAISLGKSSATAQDLRTPLTTDVPPVSIPPQDSDHEILEGIPTWARNKPKTGIGALLSVLVPGLGHIYAGHIKTGVALYIVVWAIGLATMLPASPANVVMPMVIAVSTIVWLAPRWFGIAATPKNTSVARLKKAAVYGLMFAIVAMVATSDTVAVLLLALIGLLSLLFHSFVMYGATSIVEMSQANLATLLIFSYLTIASIASDAVMVARRGQLALAKTRFWRPRVRVLVLVIVTHVVVSHLASRTFVGQPFRITGSAMQNSLLEGDFVFCKRYGVYNTIDKRLVVPYVAPVRRDVITFKSVEDDSNIGVSRIVAVGGDVVGLHHRVLYLNGRRVDEPSVSFGADNLEEPFASYGPVAVPPGHVFVLGDNRDNSRDSRVWGFLPEGNIMCHNTRIFYSWDGRAGTRYERIGQLVQ